MEKTEEKPKSPPDYSRELREVREVVAAEIAAHQPSRKELKRREKELEKIVF